MRLRDADCRVVAGPGHIRRCEARSMKGQS
jgi:hypothetical protein